MTHHVFKDGDSTTTVNVKVSLVERP